MAQIIVYQRHADCSVTTAAVLDVQENYTKDPDVLHRIADAITKGDARLRASAFIMEE